MILVASFLLFFDFGESDSRTIDEIFNFGHLLLFGCIALGILWMLNKEKWPCKESSLFIKAGIITTLIGILTEFIQLFTPSRDFEIGDMFSDGLGAITFLCIAYSYKEGLTKKNKTIIMALSLVVMVLASWRIYPAAIDDWRMKRDFPLLGSFESYLEMSRWEVKDDKQISRVKSHATSGEYSLRVNLEPGMYPGVALVHHISDWTRYNALAYDVFLEGTTPLTITVRINDKQHNEQYLDRYNEEFILNPGSNHINIVLDDVRKAPQGRTMDMADITTFCIFSYKLKEPRTVYFDNFRLNK
jgi:VanZ family protein